MERVFHNFLSQRHAIFSHGQCCKCQSSHGNANLGQIFLLGKQFFITWIMNPPLLIFTIQKKIKNPGFKFFSWDTHLCPSFFLRCSLFANFILFPPPTLSPSPQFVIQVIKQLSVYLPSPLRDIIYSLLFQGCQATAAIHKPLHFRPRHGMFNSQVGSTPAFWRTFVQVQLPLASSLFPPSLYTEGYCHFSIRPSSINI